MRKRRKVEMAEQRDKRVEQAAETKVEDAKAAEAAIDAKIKRSINLYGA